MVRLLSTLIALVALTTGVALGDTVKVVVEGVEGEVLTNVFNSLSIERYKADENLNRSWVQRLHGKAVEEIMTALRPYGYYRATVGKELRRHDGGWTATYTVDPGAPVLIGTADIRLTGEGEQDPVFSKLITEHGISAGTALNQVRYDRLKKDLQKQALEQGYFDAKFLAHEIRLDLAAYEAAIDLHFDTGKRYRFGAVSFTPGPLAENFLARYVAFKPGDAYSTRSVLGLQEALTGSDYFSRVDVVPRPEQATDYQVPVDVNLQPHKRNKYTFSIGYGTDTGGRIGAGWERRYLNRRGHRLATDLRLSEVKNSLDARYIVPLRNPRTEQLIYKAGYFDEDTDNSRSQTTLLGVSRAGTRWGLQESIGLSFQREDFTVGGVSNTALLLMPEASWTYIRADDRIYTRRGLRLQLSLRGAHEALLSDTSFAQARLQAKFIQRVFESSRIILRGDVGTSWLSDFNELPASVRFFAGGDQSVRGFDYESLAPTDATGAVVGGRHLLVGSAEYEQHIKDKWSAAVFVDTGAAVDGFADPLSTGVGIGLRWRSPIGLIRLDVAAAVSESGNPLRLHLVIGPDL